MVLLFATYEVYGKYFETKAAQAKLDTALDDKWERGRQQLQDNTSATPQPLKEEELEIGDGVAKLYIPRVDNKWVVVEGENPIDIKHAPGRFREGAMPGESGNFAIAGHRSPAIFWDLDLVQEGDYVGVETLDKWYLYQVYETTVVTPDQYDVVEPDPNDPSRKLLTLITCTPKGNNTHRIVVHAELVREQPYTDGKPSELK
ncbi:MAG: class E sortase [Corynebacteriales bacterium]|nr:class E sortase [Mycobacteriales bacterium]